MKPVDRVACAHGLLMHLEKSGDITCWNFWERETVKELVEDCIGRKPADAEVTFVMGLLTKDWDASSADDWAKFTHEIHKQSKRLRLRD